MRVGERARWTVTVANRGTVTAHQVRVVPSVRQAGLRARQVKAAAVRRRGPCATGRGIGVCYLRRLAAGAQVKLTVSARARDVLSALRLAGGGARV